MKSKPYYLAVVYFFLCVGCRARPGGTSTATEGASDITQVAAPESLGLTTFEQYKRIFFNLPPNNLPTDGIKVITNLALVDVNGDRKLDIVAADHDSSVPPKPVYTYLLGNGDGTFRAPVLSGPPIFPADDVATGFIDVGKVVDRVSVDRTIANGGFINLELNGQPPRPIKVSSNSIPGTPPDPDSIMNVYSVALGDMNSDGNLDIVVAGGADTLFRGHLGGIWVLEGKGDGTFADPTIFATGSMLSPHLRLGKINADDALDIAVSADYNFSVNVLLNVRPVKLSVDITGNGIGTVTSVPLLGFSCEKTTTTVKATCNKDFPIGTSILLTAVAPDGSKFVGWGPGCIPPATNRTCTVNLRTSVHVTAKFKKVSGGWLDVTADGSCDSRADTCIFEDVLTGKEWLESSGGGWAQASLYCENFVVEGKSDWHLSFMLELEEARNHKMSDSIAVNPFFTDMFNQRYWVKDETSPTTAWTLIPVATARSFPNSRKNSAFRFMCVRP